MNTEVVSCILMARLISEETDSPSILELVPGPVRVLGQGVTAKRSTPLRNRSEAEAELETGADVRTVTWSEKVTETAESSKVAEVMESGAKVMESSKVAEATESGAKVMESSKVAEATESGAKVMESSKVAEVMESGAKVMESSKVAEAETDGESATPVESPRSGCLVKRSGGGEGSENQEEQLWQLVSLRLTSGKRKLRGSAGQDFMLCRSPVDEVDQLGSRLQGLLAGETADVFFEPADPSFELTFHREPHGGIGVYAWIDAGNSTTGFYTWDAAGIRFHTTDEHLVCFVRELKEQFSASPDPRESTPMSAPVQFEKVEVLKGKYQDCSGFRELHDQLESDGYTVFTWQDAPGTAYQNHSHPHDELIVVASGKIVFLIDNERFLVEPGDALTLPANTQHSAVNEENVPCSYFICTRT